MNGPTRELKQLRADMDVILSLTKDLRSSREQSSGHTRLEEGKMHIVNTLFELEQAPLYKESTNASNNTIEKYHVDKDITPIAVPADWNQGTLTQNVKIIRRELDSIIGRIKALLLDVDFVIEVTKSDFAINFLTESLIKTRESMNWFGAELGRIRETTVG